MTLSSLEIVSDLSVMFVMQPSSASCGIETRLALFNPESILVFVAFLLRPGRGRWPILLSLIVVAFGSFTGGPSSVENFFSMCLSSSLQK